MVYKVFILIFAMVMWKLLKSMVLIVLALFLASGIFTSYAGDISFEDDDAGLLTGIIHGVLAPIMLVAAIFTSFTMYELNNNGWWYNFGFLFGILITWGGGKGTNHIIKNYYRPPKQEVTKKEGLKKLSEEDHKKIGKIIEEKIMSAIKFDTKSKKKIEQKEEIKKEKSLKKNNLFKKKIVQKKEKLIKKKK